MATKWKDKTSGIWQAKYYLDGKAIYRSLRTRREDVAQRKLVKLEHRLELTGLADRSRTPLESFMPVYEQHLVRKGARSPGRRACAQSNTKPVVRKSAKVELSRLGQFKNWLAQTHPNIRILEAVTIPRIAEFLAFKQEEGLKPKSLNHYRSLLSLLFDFAIQHHGYIHPDRRYPHPVTVIKRLADPPPDIRYLEIEHIDEQIGLFAALMDERRAQMNGLRDCNLPVKARNRPAWFRAQLQKLHQTQTMVAIYIYAGLRREEAMWLTPHDVQLQHNMIRIRSKTIKGEFWQPKTGRNRAVPISSALRPYLDRYDCPASSHWYFPSSDGSRWDPDNWSRYLRDVNEKAGLVWGCLDYRHSFGSHLAQKGVSLHKIAKLMGNSAQVVERHYACLVPEKLRDAVEFSANGEVQSRPDKKKIFRLEEYRNRPQSS